MSSSNCCFLTCIQVSQEAGQVVWHSHLFQNFPQFIVIHTVKSFVVVSKAEIDVFLELSCFFDDPADVGNLISWTSGSSWFTYCWSLARRIWGITLLACKISALQSYLKPEPFLPFRGDGFLAGDDRATKSPHGFWGLLNFSSIFLILIKYLIPGYSNGNSAILGFTVL